MIDFRYHLVSLISVFLALAVGIVLGAGPLRENLGDQLAGQVEQLRTEKDQLRTQSDELSARNDQLSTFVTELGPDLVEDTLTGKQVAVLTDDSSTRPDTDRVMSLLEDAGASSSVRVDLQTNLWEPGQEQRRTAAIDTIGSIAPSVLDSDLDDSEQLAQVIVLLLTPSQGEGLGPEQRTQIWQALTEQQLVTIDGELPAQVDAVVFAAAAPEVFTDEDEDETVASGRAQSLQSAQSSLLTALAGTGTPAVVSAQTPDNDASTGILRTVRGDSAFDGLSTTDRLQESDGPLLSVLALIGQTRGGSGAYGTTADAEDRLPALAELRGIEESAQQASTDDGAPSDGGGEG